MSGRRRSGAQPYQIENECSVGSLTRGPGGTAPAGRPRVGPRAVDRIPVVLGVLRRLCVVLGLHRGRPELVRDGAAGERAGLERGEHSAGLLDGVAHRRRVQEQQRRALRAREARRRDDRLDDAIERRQQLVDPVQQRLELVELEGPGVVMHRARQRIGLQMEAGDDAEEPGAGTPGRPQQIAVLRLARMDQTAVRGDEVDSDHVLAGPTQLAAVPALPPCRRKPPIPTLGQCPPVKARPCEVRWGVSSAAPLTAGLAVAIPVAGS